MINNITMQSCVIFSSDLDISVARIPTPLAENGLSPFQISSMPVKETQVQIISVTDPDNINIRLCSWVRNIHLHLIFEISGSNARLSLLGTCS